MSSAFVISPRSKLDLSIKLADESDKEIPIERHPGGTINGSVFVNILPSAHTTAISSSGLHHTTHDIVIDQLRVCIEGKFTSIVPYLEDDGSQYGPGIIRTDKFSLKFLDQITTLNPDEYTLIGAGSGSPSPTQLEYPFFFKIPTKFENIDPRIVATQTLPELEEAIQQNTLPPSISVPYLHVKYHLKTTITYHYVTEDTSPNTKKIEKAIKIVPLSGIEPPRTVEDYPDELKLSDKTIVETATTFASAKQIGSLTVTVSDEPKPLNIHGSSSVASSSNAKSSQESRGGTSLMLTLLYRPSNDFDCKESDILQSLESCHIEMNHSVLTQTFNATSPMDKSPTIKSAVQGLKLVFDEQGNIFRHGPRIRYSENEEQLHTFEMDVRSWTPCELLSSVDDDEVVIGKGKQRQSRLSSQTAYIAQLKLPIPIETDKLVSPSFRTQMAEIRYIIALKMKAKMGKGKYHTARTMNVKVPLQVVNQPKDNGKEDLNTPRRVSATGDPVDVEFEDIGEKPPEYFTRDY